MAAPPIVSDWDLSGHRLRAPRRSRSGVGPAGDASPGAAWVWLCAASVIPLAAACHNLLFYIQECMLNSFGPDYTPAVIWSWLSRDPSLATAIVLAVALHRAGRRLPRLRSLLPPFLVAFLPLSLWIWDIPFTGRSVCRLLHDKQVHLVGDVPLLARHLYALGVVAFCAMALPRLRPARREERPAQGAPALAPVRAVGGLRVVR